jgi:large subunit ribosomal protein L3
MKVEGILGRKLGMTQLFASDGMARPVTVLEVLPSTVVQVKTVEKDGYAAIQLGYGWRKRLNKPLKGHVKGLGSFRYLREFRVDDPKEWQVGQKVGCELFQPGDLVDITGISKGKGFAGVVKRHGFAGGPKSHGQSDRWRAPGSIGAGTDPGRVIKGLRMAGHMGARQVTVKNLLVVHVDPAKGIMMVQGAVPGHKGSLLKIKFAKSADDLKRRRAKARVAGG